MIHPIKQNSIHVNTWPFIGIGFYYKENEPETEYDLSCNIGDSVVPFYDLIPLLNANVVSTQFVSFITNYMHGVIHMNYRGLILNSNIQYQNYLIEIIQTIKSS